MITCPSSRHAMSRVPPSSSTAAWRAGETAAMGGDEGGAGGAAAGPGDPGPALPDAQPQMALVANFGDADIGALREQRVALEHGAERRQIDRRGVIDKEGGVRIADIGADRCRQRPQRQVEAIGIGGAGERDLAPAGAHRPHIDRDQPIAHDFGVEQSGRGFDRARADRRSRGAAARRCSAWRCRRPRPRCRRG